MKTPLKAVEAVEGGEVTFSVDLTSASAGEWFLDGQALKASSVYVIRCDGTRHTVTIRSVPASLHGAELKFVANGIESSIRMEVRGRGTPAHDTWASLSPVSSGAGGRRMVVPRPQGSWRTQASCWVCGLDESGPTVGWGVRDSLPSLARSPSHRV